MGFSVVYWSSYNFVYWGSNNFGNWSYDFVSAWFTSDNCVEAIVVISGVFYNTVVTVSIVEAVGSMYNISVTAFLLLFNVSGMFVMDRV